jgi:hypothetical protein
MQGKRWAMILGTSMATLHVAIIFFFILKNVVVLVNIYHRHHHHPSLASSLTPT